MTGDDVVQLFAAAGGASILTAFINALFNKRKLGAEATEIITKGAAGIVERVEADNKRLREEMAANEARHSKELGDAEARHQQAIGVLRAEVEQLRRTQSISDSRERMHLVAEERNRSHLERWHRYGDRCDMMLRAANIDPPEPPPRFPEPLVPAYPNDHEDLSGATD
jgi:hypothetical protein